MKSLTKTEKIISGIVVILVALGGYGYYDHVTSKNELETKQINTVETDVRELPVTTEESSDEVVLTTDKESTVQDEVVISEEDVVLTTEPVPEEAIVPEEQKY